MKDKRPKKDNDATYTKLRGSYKMVHERNSREQEFFMSLFSGKVQGKKQGHGLEM